MTREVIFQHNFLGADLAGARQARDFFYENNPNQIFEGTIIKLSNLSDEHLAYELRSFDQWVETEADELIPEKIGQLLDSQWEPNRVPFMNEDGEVISSPIKMLDDGNAFIAGRPVFESGTIDLGRLVSISESGGFVHITNSINNDDFTLLDFRTNRDEESRKPRRLALIEAETEITIQNVTDNEVNSPVVFDYNTQLLARTNAIKINVGEAITNLRMRISDFRNNELTIMKYWPSEEEFVAGSGKDVDAGEYTIDFTDSPFSIDSNRFLRIEVMFDQGHLMGSTDITTLETQNFSNISANGVPSITNILQRGEFIESADVEDLIKPLLNGTHTNISVTQGTDVDGLPVINLTSTGGAGTPASTADQVTVSSTNLHGLLHQIGNVQNALERIDATGLGAPVTRFTTNTYTATDANSGEWFNREITSSGNNNGNRVVNMPSDEVVDNIVTSTEAEYPVRMFISHNHGTNESVFFNRLDVRGDILVRTPTARNLVTGDRVTMRKDSLEDQWVVEFRGLSSALTSGTALDDIQLRDELFDARGDSILPQDVAKGYAFRVVSGGEEVEFLGEYFFDGDWIVWSNDTYDGWSNTNHWFRIAHHDVRRLTSQASNFLQEVTETDVTSGEATLDNVRIWLLDDYPTAAPLLSESQLGSYTDTQTLVDKYLLVAVPITHLNDGNLRLHDDYPATDQHETFSFVDNFVDFSSVIPDNSNGRYYLMGSATDSARLFRLTNGHTLTVQQTQTDREFTLSDHVHLNNNIVDLPIDKLEPRARVILESNQNISSEDNVKLSGLEVTEVSQEFNGNILAKIGDPTSVQSDYHTVGNLNGLLPDYDRTTKYTILVDKTFTVNGLRKVEDNNTTISVTESGVILDKHAYIVTLPAVTAPDNVLDNAWQIYGGISELSGANESFKIDRDNLDSELSGRIFNTPHPSQTTLPDQLDQLSNVLEIEHDETSVWTEKEPPIRANLTRVAAALFDENRRTFTGNYFEDLSATVGSFQSNNVFYYPDPDSESNRAMRGHQSYILNTPCRISDISADFRKVISFDFSDQRTINSSDDLRMLRAGSSANLLKISRNEGLYVEVGRGDGEQQSRIRNISLDVINSQLGTLTGQTAQGESEIVLSQNLTGSQQVTINIQGWDNDNNEGTQNIVLNIPDVNSSVASSDHVLSFNIIPDVTVSIEYQHDNNDLDHSRRVVFVRFPSLTNSAIHYIVSASYQVTEIWNTSATYVRHPVNDAGGHDSHGLFNPTLYETEQVNHVNRITVIVKKYREDDTDTDPEISLTVVTDGVIHNDIRLHRRASEFDFSDLRFGDFAFAVSRLQVYDYAGSPPSEGEAHILYGVRDVWMNAFIPPGLETETIKINSFLESRDGFVFEAGGIKYVLTINSSGEVVVNPKP